jgi:hypothetical protein
MFYIVSGDIFEYAARIGRAGPKIALEGGMGPWRLNASFAVTGRHVGMMTTARLGCG